MPQSEAATRKRMAFLSRSLCRSGDKHRAAGKYSQAEEFYQQALTVAQQVYGDRDVETSVIFNNLAVLYKYTGDYEKALKLYRRALQIIEESLGREHPDTAAIYHNLGGLEHERGHHAQGEPFARRALEITKRRFGTDHPNTAADMAALAAFWMDRASMTSLNRYTFAHSPFLNWRMGRSTMKSR